MLLVTVAEVFNVVFEALLIFTPLMGFASTKEKLAFGWAEASWAVSVMLVPTATVVDG